MADYPVLPSPAPLEPAIRNALQAMRAAQPHIALPPRRLDLEKAAAELERVMKENAS